jgi:hypothetical protein
VCEYDGTPRVYDKAVAMADLLGPITIYGREDACPACEVDIAEHNEECLECRQMAEESEVRP